MKSIITASIIFAGIAFAPVMATAGERVNDAIMGGASGALVAGPVGLVAGGVIGFVAGPDIARGMDQRHPRRVYQRRVDRDVRVER